MSLYWLLLLLVAPKVSSSLCSGIVSGLLQKFSQCLIVQIGIGRLFTTDEKVVALVAVVLPIIAVFQVADGVTGIMSGLLRGAGRSVSSCAC